MSNFIYANRDNSSHHPFCAIHDAVTPLLHLEAYFHHTKMLSRIPDADVSQAIHTKQNEHRCIKQ